MSMQGRLPADTRDVTEEEDIYKVFSVAKESLASGKTLSGQGF